MAGELGFEPRVSAFRAQRAAVTPLPTNGSGILPFYRALFKRSDTV